MENWLRNMEINDWIYHGIWHKEINVNKIGMMLIFFQLNIFLIVISCIDRYYIKTIFVESHKSGNNTEQDLV